jgi:SAM-dependent methyltransferase
VTKANEWEVFFDGHAPHYREEPFTRNTAAKIEFLVAELKLAEGASILDIGCGIGRHAVPLAQRGFQVTGVDISQGMLAQARQAAQAAGVQIEWVHADAAAYRSERRFDAAICLCEGAFGLLGSADDPLQHELGILQGVSESLKPGGRFVVTALNGMLKIRSATPESVEAGGFDPLTLLEVYTLPLKGAGEAPSQPLRERGFVPSELALMLNISGLQVEHLWGGTAGSWLRQPPELDEMELMAIAHKPG